MRVVLFVYPIELVSPTLYLTVVVFPNIPYLLKQEVSLIQDEEIYLPPLSYLNMDSTKRDWNISITLSLKELVNRNASQNAMEW